MSKARLRAEAINRFVTDAKAQGVYDSLKAACILTGWDTLAGALTPLVGSAPTNNGFVAADYDRGGQGLKGNGSSKYLNSNRAANADAQNNRHVSVYASTPASPGVGTGYIGEATAFTLLYSRVSPPSLIGRVSCTTYTTFSSDPSAAGFLGGSRNDASTQEFRSGGNAAIESIASTGDGGTAKTMVFSYNGSANSNARISWYSIGSSLDLSALDTLVTRLMADLRAIEEDGMDRDALAYIRAVEAADGSFMVTGVKQAVDRLVKGLKYDRDANGRSAWDAIGASCLLCGPRTIAGALVPLRGAAPTAYNFVSADYNQETGLKDSDSQGYIRTNYSATNDPQSDHHISTYITEASAFDRHTSGARYNGTPTAPLLASGYVTYSYTLNTYVGLGSGVPVGFYGMSRANLSQIDWIRASSAKTTSTLAALPFESAGNDHCVYKYMGQNNQPYGTSFDGRIAFYSFGRSLDVASLGSRITKYVNDVAAAIP